MFMFVLGIIATAIGILGGGYSIYRYWQDNSKLKVTAEFHPPNKFTVTAVNHGRRKVIIEDIEAVASNKKNIIIKLSNLGGVPLGELEKSQIPQPEIYAMLNSIDAKWLYVIDSTGKEYYVKNSKEKLALYYPAAKAPIAPEFEGKIAHKCSRCEFIFMVLAHNPNDATRPTVTCPDQRCRHVD